VKADDLGCIRSERKTAMAKSKQVYTCSACGAQASQWGGQCRECGAWNTLMEVLVSDRPAGRHARYQGYAGASTVCALEDVSLEKQPRTALGMAELDRVLGGGLVQGSVVLIGGDPGVGKSTLLLQAMVALGEQLRTLYITGEESLQQVRLRARRLALQAPNLQLLSETNVERIMEHARRQQPQVMVIDSIQTVYTDQLQSVPGSVAQVRESAAQLVRYAKQSGTAVFLVGHVTKEGTLAGPRVLEHMVDTVLYFEGDSSGPYRVIRAVKNRFGAVNEIGVFAMTDRGLREVPNPSAIFLSRHSEPVAGSIIMVTREGTRPMLVEVQALVDDSPLSNPRRMALGLDSSRLSMLLAVLHRHCGIALFDQDVYVNVVGGMRINETGVDLAAILAILSSYRDRPLPTDWVVFGEVGLAGEVRPVHNGQERLREAAKHGFRRAIIAQANAPKRPVEGLEIIAVNRLGEALEHLD
jgi:DNA repair protein RadA/Sms